MSKLLREISLTANRPLHPQDGVVENMSRVICALFILGLQKKIKTSSFWKISIRINRPDNAEHKKIMLGVLFYNRSFPVEEFLSWDLSIRQSYMLKFITVTLVEILAEEGVDPAVVENAAQFVMKKKYFNLIQSKKKFKNPFSLEVAHIECEQEMDEARIYVCFNERKKKNRVLVAKADPDEFIFQRFFGEIVWDDDGQPSLKQIGGNLIPIRCTA